MDILEKEFDIFLREQKLSSRLNTQTFLEAVKIFLSNQRPTRKQVFGKTRLRHADCITRSIIAQMLATRKGHVVKIGYPRQINKFIHTVLLYPKDGKLELFEIAGGKSPSLRLKVLTQKQLMRRFRLTYPIFAIPPRKIKPKRG